MQSCFHTSHEKTFFISNKQKYTRSTHAVASMYSNIKKINRQRRTWIFSKISHKKDFKKDLFLTEYT